MQSVLDLKPLKRKLEEGEMICLGYEQGEVFFFSLAVLGCEYCSLGLFSCCACLLDDD